MTNIYFLTVFFQAHHPGNNTGYLHDYLSGSVEAIKIPVMHPGNLLMQMTSSRLGPLFLHTTQGHRQRMTLKYMNFFHVAEQKHCIISTPNLYSSDRGTASNPHHQPSFIE